MSLEAQLEDALLSAEIALYEGGRERREGALLVEVAKARRLGTNAEKLAALRSVASDLEEMGEAGTGCALYKKVTAALEAAS